MNNEAVNNAPSHFRMEVSAGARWRVVIRKRPVRVGAEAGYDLMAWLSGILIAAAATSDMADGSGGGGLFGPLLLAAAGLSITTGLLAGLYRGRYQRGSLDEVLSVGIAVALMTVALTVVSLLADGRHAPLATVAGAALFALLAMGGARYVVCAVRQLRRQRAAADTRVIVFGAGDAGTAFISRLLVEPDAAYRPVALLDDDPAKRRLRIRGVPVLGDRNRMADVAAATGATVLVIAIARARGAVIRDLTTRAEEAGLTPKVIPTVSELLSGSARIEGVRDPRISDLLGRQPVRTDVHAVAGQLSGQRILVTGAGGAIGSELFRQLHRFGPAQLIMLDRDESALHEVQLALHGRALLDSDETVLADIRDPRRVHEVFQRFRPQIVFHAAALKHLPLLERYPAEAVKTNIWGTQHVLEAAAATGTASFVNISTDKAADPVSILGYSKRIAERLTADMARHAGGSYLSVRFGNVLGSRGSVLGALSAQVAAGGPLTRQPELAKSDFFTRPLSSAGIRALLTGVEKLQTAPSTPGLSGGVAFDACGGAINRVGAGDTAFVHRDALFLAQYTTTWDNGAGPAVAGQQRSAQQALWQSMRPYASGQAYQNYIDPALPTWRQAYYGANYSRLAQVKHSYDPDRLFTFPQAVS